LFRAAKRTVGTVNTPIARLRSRRAIPRLERPIALEIGGRRPRAGWFVTDVGATTRHYLDATARWPFEDGALSRIFADNMIEHITLEGARRFLAEAHRCLQPGGVIRLVTPDIGRHVEVYLGGADAVRGPVAEHYRQLGVPVEHPVDLVRIPIGVFGHHVGQVYDFHALAAELERAGFRDPVSCEVGESTHPDLRELERRVDGGQWQLVVEATR
jgi:predicted SAM-dependent methyltransferase